MKLTILGSGSKGNSTLLDFGDKKILVDVGFSYRALKDKLENIGVHPKEIDYIFITHEHGDHVMGLKTLLNKHKPFLCVSEKLERTLFVDYKYEKTNLYYDEVLIDDVLVKAISTSHDAVDSKGFVIEYKETSVVYITDTGYIHQNNFQFIKNKNYYIIESNHDIEMLMNSKYPYYLQQRIRGNTGHLSNELTASYLVKLIGKKTKKIILAHLSEENNTPELAKKTVERVFKENNIVFDEIECASQDEILEVIK